MSCKTLSDTEITVMTPCLVALMQSSGKQDFRQTRVQIADCTGADGLV